MASTFDEDTGLEPAGEGRWRGRIDGGWWVQRGPNGGYVAAIVLRALTLAVADPARHPRSLTVHYLEAPVEGPVELTAHVERAGRSLSTATARMVQDGRTVAFAVGAFAAGRDSSIAFSHAEPPTLLPAAERPALERAGDPPPVHGKWENEIALGGPWGRSDRALTGGTIRLAEEGRELDALVAAAAMDAWFPPVFVRHAGPVGVPTVDLTIHFLGPLPHPGTTADTRYTCRFRTDVAGGGYLVEDGELWAPDGSLLVVARQLAVTVG